MHPRPPPCLTLPPKRGGIGLALVLFASIWNLQSQHNIGPRRPDGMGSPQEPSRKFNLAKRTVGGRHFTNGGSV